MRFLIVFLFSTCLGGSALAQSVTPAGTPAPATTPMPTTLNGKFVVGYEGRGDYTKNLSSGKKIGDAGADKVLADANSPSNASKGKAAGPVTEAADTDKAETESAENSPPPAKPALRNDTKLSSDAPKPKAEPVSTTAETAKPANVVVPVTNASPVNNPMVLVGGRIQR